MTEKKSRPKQLEGKTIKVSTGCGSMYVTLNGDDGGVFEVFAALGKSGSCAKVQTEALTRMVTLALKYGVPMKEIVDELNGLQCPNPIMFPLEERVLSCPDGIARILRQEVREEEEEERKVREEGERV